MNRFTRCLISPSCGVYVFLNYFLHLFFSFRLGYENIYIASPPDVRLMYGESVFLFLLLFSLSIALISSTVS